jgi:hypothetical protein
MKLSSWALFPISLPYRRKVVWANASESASPLLVLKLVAEDGSVGARVDWDRVRSLSAVH